LKRALQALVRVFSAAALVLLPACALAEGVGSVQQRLDLERADREAIEYKLTPSYYRTSHQADAYDINLRGNLGSHTAWVGYYRQAADFEQLRVGYEYALALPFGRFTPSFQYASRGFLGGSVTLEVGERWFGLLGMGRTNLKDYFNLNFDPNDSILVGGGTRVLPKTTLTAYQIRDDRLNTGQRVTHVIARVKPTEGTRWTVDVFHREGRFSAEDEVVVRGTGVSVTYDYERYFLRVASDPHVNFTREHMLRVAAGLRF
jgi:hypothetical protein